jgi:flotillin
MITNGGVFVLPVLETFKMLDMTIMTIKQEKDEVYTVSGVPIKLDWVAQVQVDPSEASLRTATRAFLDKTKDEIRAILEETLSANFRAIVGQMSVESIHRDRDSFVQKVQDLARDDVAAMGVRIIAMGIEEITDDQGYLTAMAAPQIAAVKRDAKIAEAEAEREARIKAAAATREGEQAELEAQRDILQQREELSIREVEVDRKVGISRADSDREVQQQRAQAVEQQQEAEVLVPARAERQAIEIRAEGQRRKIVIEAEADANATRSRAEASASATEQTGRADASALQAMREAEAAGERAKLLAEAEGRRELAAASAAEDEINQRQFMIEQLTQADIAKVEALSMALAGLGNNVRMVQFSGGSGGNGSNGAGGTGGATGNVLMDLLMNIPEVAEVFRTKVEALSGDDFESSVRRVSQLLELLRGGENHNTPATLPDGTPNPTETIPPGIEEEDDAK